MLQVVLFWICYQVLAQVDIFRWKICWKNPLANFYRSVTKPHPFKRGSFLLVTPKWQKPSWNISQKFLEECNVSLSSLYLTRNIEPTMLYPYFICEWIESFFVKIFHFYCEFFTLITIRHYQVLFYCFAKGYRIDLNS